MPGVFDEHYKFMWEDVLPKIVKIQIKVEFH